MAVGLRSARLPRLRTAIGLRATHPLVPLSHPPAEMVLRDKVKFSVKIILGAPHQHVSRVLVLLFV